MNITSKISVFVLFLAFATCGNAQVLDFTGWDHGTVSGGGQTFTDICGDLDVTVSTDGTFDADSTFALTMDGGTSAIRSSHDGPGEHCFTFEFSEAIDLSLDMMILDANEIFTVTTNGDESYMHMSGSAPIETYPVAGPHGTGIMLEGVGFGLDPLTGAGTGIIKAEGVTSLTVCYESLADGTQYGDFLVSKVVPEPGSLPLLLIGGLGLLNTTRRRRRR